MPTPTTAPTAGPSCLPLVSKSYGSYFATVLTRLGADDDGSGSMSILEAYRALIAAGWQPERAVEFHWYAAEVRFPLPCFDAYLYRYVFAITGRGAPRISSCRAFVRESQCQHCGHEPGSRLSF